MLDAWRVLSSRERREEAPVFVTVTSNCVIVVAPSFHELVCFCEMERRHPLLTPVVEDDAEEDVTDEVAAAVVTAEVAAAVVTAAVDETAAAVATAATEGLLHEGVMKESVRGADADVE